MPNELEVSLVVGGMAPAAAKIVANAIANVASPLKSTGRLYSDATPAKPMRMVDSDTRRYVLTNLDHAPEEAFRRSLDRSGGTYKPRDTAHPYSDSQPATSQGTLATPSVKEGDYVSVTTTPKDSVAQSTVSLRVNQAGGPHLRLNSQSKAIDAVPFSVEIDQEQWVEARFEERPTGTVLRITLKNLKQYTLSNGTKFWCFQSPAND